MSAAAPPVWSPGPARLPRALYIIQRGGDGGERTEIERERCYGEEEGKEEGGKRWLKECGGGGMNGTPGKTWCASPTGDRVNR